MERKILIKTQSLSMSAVLDNSDTAAKIAEALPFKEKGRLWGDEIYFDIPLSLPAENPKEIVEKGALAYWPQGNGFCIFFGPTPASEGDEIRPASGVNVFGKVEGNPEEFKKFKEGENIVVEKL
ncbi:MAG: cyclophilin-like fold protein [Elusimicrobiota bacterium]